MRNDRAAYRLHARALPDLAPIAAACGCAPAEGAILAGDIVLVRVGPCQFHLLIAAPCPVSGGDRFVHAHAALGRVIVSPGPPGWPVIGHWRPSSCL